MFSELVEIALVKKKIKKRDLAECLNCTPANIYAKFKRNTFTEADMISIANILNCTFECCFVDNETGSQL